jgi:hypothetical protein
MTEVADQTTVKTGRRRPRFKSTAANRKNHVESWRQSGVSKTDYARQHGIPVSCFNKWTMDAERGKNSAFKAAKIIHPSPAQFSPDTGNIEILVGQSVRIRLSVCDSSLIVGIVKGLANAADH